MASQPGTMVNSGSLTIETNWEWEESAALHNLAGSTVRQTVGHAWIDTVNNAGTLELDGGLFEAITSFNCADSSAYTVVLDGYAAGADLGRMGAPAVNVAGSLLVSLANGFVPTNGASFVLAQGASVTGQFTGLRLSALPGGNGWSLDYGPTAISLKVVSATPHLDEVTPLSDGRFQLRLVGAAGAGYDIQASTNLVDWMTVQTNSPFAGTLIFTDDDATNFTQHFYRGRTYGQ